MEEVLYDFWVTCRDQDCSPSAIIRNDEKNIFQLTAILTTIAQISTEEVRQDEHAYAYYHDEYKSIGSAVGSLLRISFGFEEK